MKQLGALIILIFTTHVNLAQNSGIKRISGKVVSEALDLDGIYVVNLKSEKAITTEKGGYFEIDAAVGDTIMFSAIQIKGKKVVISDKDFEKELLLIKLEPMINRLEEVIVKQYKNINAVSLGIISANMPRYTPAERRLKTASGIGLEGNKDGSMGGSAGLDPLFNWVSGRTAMLKKELEVERKERMLERIENLFGVAYFSEKLKIPKEYIKGFWYYIVDEPRFLTAVNTKNKTMASFVLTELSVKYLELQKCDK